MSRRVAALAGAVCAVVLVGCGGGPGPEVVSPSPTVTGPLPVAQIAPLEPASPAPGQFDDHPAVRVFRETSVVAAWANLINSSSFAQVTQYVDPHAGLGIIGLSDFMERYEYVAVGPSPNVIESVTENADGTTTLRVCLGRAREVSKANGELRVQGQSPGSPLEITLSPLTEAEVVEVEGLGLDVPPLRERETERPIGLECDVSAAVQQVFVDWESHAPIGEYGVPDPMDVAVLDGEGDVEYRDQEDIP